MTRVAVKPNPYWGATQRIAVVCLAQIIIVNTGGTKQEFLGGPSALTYSLPRGIRANPLNFIGKTGVATESQSTMRFDSAFKSMHS